MHERRSCLAALLLLLSGASRADEVEAPPLPEEPGEEARWTNLLRVEAMPWALLSRGGAGTDEGFLQLEPTLVFEYGAEFGVNLGAPVRLRFWGPDGGGVFRREDWDSLSDWGQLVRSLKLGSDTAPLGVWFGTLEGYGMLSGHLVRRYSNNVNPNYHPAAGALTGTLGPVYVEAFASDVLGARLMGAEAELDLEHVFFGKPKQKARYTLGLSAVHDWGRAGGRSPSVTLAHMDAVAMVVIRPGFEAHVFAGGGGRPGEAGAWGAVAGVGADAVTPTLDLILRLEGRLQRGGFRQGFIGADYELARFQAVGPDAVPLADATFPRWLLGFR